MNPSELWLLILLLSSSFVFFLHICRITHDLKAQWLNLFTVHYLILRPVYRTSKNILRETNIQTNYAHQKFCVVKLRKFLTSSGTLKQWTNASYTFLPIPHDANDRRGIMVSSHSAFLPIRWLMAFNWSKDLPCTQTGRWGKYTSGCLAKWLAKKIWIQRMYVCRRM